MAVLWRVVGQVNGGHRFSAGSSTHGTWRTQPPRQSPAHMSSHGVPRPAFSVPLLEPETTLLNCLMMAPLHIINGKSSTSSLEKSLCFSSPTAE